MASESNWPDWVTEPWVRFQIGDIYLSDFASHVESRFPKEAWLHHFLLLHQMVEARGVDNFLTYVTELLTLVHGTRPESLRSQEQIRLDEVLQFKNMDDLISHLVERRVTRLAYGGLVEITDSLSKNLSFELFVNDKDLQAAIRIVESRNIIVHNRGIANQRFHDRVEENVETLDDGRLWLTPDSVIADINFLKSSVDDIDCRARDKFNFPRLVPSSDYLAALERCQYHVEESQDS